MLNLTIVITKKRLLEFFSISIYAAFDTVLMIMQYSLTQRRIHCTNSCQRISNQSCHLDGKKTRINPYPT
jgi:hypothetical protein